MDIVAIVGYHSPAIEVLRRASTLVGGDCRILVLSPEASAKRIDAIERSSAIVLYTHTLPPSVEEAIARSSARIVVSISESYAHLNRCDIETLRSVALYFKYGGAENYANMFRYILWKLGLRRKAPEPPRETPWAGIWHPKLGIFTDIDEYLGKYYASSRPLVGILFYRTWLLYSTLDPVRILVEELEAQSLGVVPVFTSGYRNEITGEPSAEDTIRRFFLDGDRPRIELLIDMLSFFLLDHGRSREWSKRFGVVTGIELLKKLGVVVLKPLRDYYQSVDEWLRGSGIKHLAQVYEVIMPEVDGVAEPIFLSGSRDMGEYRVPELFREHAKYIAKRVRRWIDLRRKPPRERRIAIVLNNPPCKQVEATIGVGLGLDVPESIVRLLYRLRDKGYWLGEDPLPKSGEELIKIMLERRAVSEFRWTSVRDIVERGGYVGMVDIDTYMQWFNELPENVRQDMLKEWGDPRDVVSGKVGKIFAGAIHDGKFIVPGIRFGNVVIVPQPKFGCAGSLCDGRACKILHRPDIPPPHQWLAVYRWITRVFRADMIIHFGTHGYLEFRPGKGVGLSPSCWPEISIDDVPFLYVYVVSNPMEGVIAKRRGYAVLVDHVYPAMMDACGGLSELDRLLEEYTRAASLGEQYRAEILLNSITKLVRELGLPIDTSKDPRELVDGLHRLLDTVRRSQVEKGLHIFGHISMSIEDLAQHVVTVMRFNTSSWPSILRAVAEYLGLDYDSIESNPGGFCAKLGVSNRKAMEILHDIAKHALAQLLSEGIEADELSWERLEYALHRAVNEVLRE